MKVKYLLILSFAMILTYALTACNQENSKRAAAKEYLSQQTTQYEEPPVAEVSDKAVKILTDQNFDNTIASGVTLVDFWATWCRPCLIQAPIIDEIAAEMKDKVQVGKLDIDQNKIVPYRFQVQNIPTLLIFKDGKMVDRIVGLTDKNTIVTYLNKHI